MARKLNPFKYNNTLMKKIFWIITALATGVYVFIPEPTDIIPILGWLDEATAIALLAYALKQLDIDIFDRFFNKKTKAEKTIIIEKDK